MKILLFGKHGQLGWELHRSLQGLGEVLAYDFPEVDFKAHSSLKRLVINVAPQIVINAAAYTDVDKAESEPGQARLINAEAPRILAETCRDLGAAFIHYSTDYVFDGTKGIPYTEEDSPNPLNVYGQTKLAGEQAILGTGGFNLIFRTAWVYSMRRDSFVTKLLSWAHTQNEVRIAEDQTSNPTWARSLAEITAQLIAKAGPEFFPWLAERLGLYHLAGDGFVSRLDWAKAILKNYSKADGQLINEIRPAQSSDFHTQAMRPCFSALDCHKFNNVFGLHLPDWQLSLRLAMESA